MRLSPQEKKVLKIVLKRVQEGKANALELLVKKLLEEIKIRDKRYKDKFEQVEESKPLHKRIPWYMRDKDGNAI